MFIISVNYNFLSALRLMLSFTTLVFCCAAPNIYAATFTVTRNDDRDQTCNSGVDCSLREAVKEANAAASADVINFAPGLTSITLASGDTGDIKISAAGSLTINGPGANLLTIDGGAGSNRIFDLNSATVTIFGVKIQGGGGNANQDNGSGGAIYAAGGSLVLNSVVIDNNGGANVIGGAITFFAGSHKIINSTISNNHSKFGAIYLVNSSGLLSIANSTISGNSAVASGTACAGICNEGTIKIRNSTITANIAANGDGGGIANFGTLNVGNTIIAGNIALGEREIAGYNNNITSVGFNLIGDLAGDSSNTGMTVTYQASDILDTAPQLGALTIANGGATPTYALLPGSPAIDNGSNTLAIDPFNAANLTFDQRGLERIVDGNGDNSARVDIGAYEAQTLLTAANASISGRVLAGGKGVANARIEITGTGGAARTVTTNSFGNFTISEVNSGATYVVNVSAKRYSFASQVVSVTDNVSDLIFTAQ